MVVCLYLLAGALTLFVCLSGCVGYYLKLKRSKLLIPTRILRFMVAILFTTFFITVLAFHVTLVDCVKDKSTGHLVMREFQDQQIRTLGNFGLELLLFLRCARGRMSKNLHYTFKSVSRWWLYCKYG